MMQTAAVRPSLPRRLKRALQRHGLHGFLKLCFLNVAELLTGRWKRHSYVYDASFDAEHGVDTAGVVEVDELAANGSVKASAERYEATPPSCFAHLIDAAKIGPPADYHFVDLGSGKGRVLLLAKLAGFRTVSGVEMCENLHRTAAANVAAKWNGPDSPRAILGDATRYQFPPRPTVCFLNNPFGPPVLERALENIEQSLIACPREFVLIYYHCNHARLIDERAGWRRLANGHWQHKAHHYSIYSWSGKAAE